MSDDRPSPQLDTTSFTSWIINETGVDLSLKTSSANPTWKFVPPQTIANGTNGQFGNVGTFSQNATGYVTYVAGDITNTPAVTVSWTIAWNDPNDVQFTADSPLKIVQNGGSGGLNPDPSYTVTNTA